MKEDKGEHFYPLSINYLASLANIGLGFANGPTLYRSSRFHKAWNVAAVDAMVSQIVSVANESATFVSLSLKMDTKTLASVRKNMFTLRKKALIGERRLK